jgi:hypothetical protein
LLKKSKSFFANVSDINMKNTEWKQGTFDAGLPVQESNDGTNCGVYVVMYVDFSFVNYNGLKSVHLITKKKSAALVGWLGSR